MVFDEGRLQICTRPFTHVILQSIFARVCVCVCEHTPALSSLKSHKRMQYFMSHAVQRLNSGSGSISGTPSGVVKSGKDARGREGGSEREREICELFYWR